MDNALANLLSAANTDDAFLGHADLNGLTCADRLMAAKVLVPSVSARWVTCPWCDDEHLVPVEEVKLKRAVRFFVMCKAGGTDEVTIDVLRRWRIDSVALATLVATAVCTTPRVETIVTGRVWRLGDRVMDGEKRIVLLFRGFGWSDSQAIQATATQSMAASNVIVLTLDAPGEIGRASCEFAAVISLLDLMRCEGDKLQFDADRLDESMPRSHETGDKPLVDMETLTVRYKGKDCRFTPRSKALFRLMARICRRPGHRVSYDTLREEVLENSLMEDSSIDSAFTRLRNLLRESPLAAIVPCIRTDSVDGKCAYLDLTLYGSTDKSK